MKLNIVIIGTVLVLLTVACEPASTERITYDGVYSVNIVKACDDKVICYYHAEGYGGGMDCFRDEDLVTKHCGGTK